MEYEMVREIKNLCPNNQMRDIFFDEVETDDPVAYVRFASVYLAFSDVDDFVRVISELQN